MERLMDRKEVPVEIERKMKLWRHGFGRLPQDYIEWHHELARTQLETLKEKYKLTVHRSFLRSDGWMDGMYVLHATVVTDSDRIVKLVWHDGNQEFFVRYEFGAGTLGESDLK